MGLKYKIVKTDDSEEYLFDVNSVELEYLDLTGESILKFNIWPYDVKGYVIELSLNQIKSFCTFD
jgi:hypothetical protein